MKLMIKMLLMVPILLSSETSAASAKSREVKDCPDLITSTDLRGKDPLASEIVLSNLRYHKTKFKVPFPEDAELRIHNIKSPTGSSGTLGLILFKAGAELVGIPAAFSVKSAKSPKEVQSGKVMYELGTQNENGFQIHNAEVTRKLNNPRGGPMLSVIHSRLKLKEGRLTYAALMVPVMIAKETEDIGPSNDFAGYHETLCLESAELKAIP